MHAKKSQKKTIIVIMIASLLIGFGVLFEYIDQLINYQIKLQVQLATNKEVLRLWSKPPIQARTVYWLFNLENAEQFLNGSKPRVRKVGPFNFKTSFEKRILGLSENKLKIAYNSTRFAHYDTSEHMQRRQANLDEPLTLVNILFASLVSGAREISAKLKDPTVAKMTVIGIKKIAEKFNETLLLNITAREALFGRPVPILKRLTKMAETFGAESDSGLSSDDTQLPTLPQNGLFGLVSLMNGSWQGPFEVFTGYGVSTPSLGDLISFQGKRRQRIYSGQCNRLQASAGELRPMPIRDGQILEMYRPEVCRVLRLEQVGPAIRVPAGPSYRYKFVASDFASGYSNKNNRCFCYNSTVHPYENYCSLEGVLEPGPCLYHSPMVLAFSPIDFDQRIKDSLDNWDETLFEAKLDDLNELKPNNEYNMIVLRRIGVPIKVDLTIIAFVKLRRDASRSQMQNLPEISYLPAFMSRDMFELPPQFEKMLVSIEEFIELCERMKLIVFCVAMLLLLLLAIERFFGISKTSTRRGSSNKERVANSVDSGDDGSINNLSANLKSSARFESLNATHLAINVGEVPPKGMFARHVPRVTATAKQQSEPSTLVESRQRDDAVNFKQAKNNNEGEAQKRSRQVNTQLAASTKEAPNSTHQIPASRANVFSKVDEEFEAQGRQKAQSLKSSSGDRNEEQNSLDKKLNSLSYTASANILSERSNLKLNNAEDQTNKEEDLVKSPLGRKNWLSNVYSTFIRTIIGWRLLESTKPSSTTKTASRDVGNRKTTDEQDKKLEELASRIANWGGKLAKSVDNNSVEVYSHNATEKQPNTTSTTISDANVINSTSNDRIENGSRSQLLFDGNQTAAESPTQIDIAQNEHSAKSNNDSNTDFTEQRVDESKSVGAVATKRDISSGEISAFEFEVKPAVSINNGKISDTASATSKIKEEGKNQVSGTAVALLTQGATSDVATAQRSSRVRRTSSDKAKFTLSASDNDHVDHDMREIEANIREALAAASGVATSVLPAMTQAEFSNSLVKGESRQAITGAV